MKRIHWITFTDGTAGCVESEEGEDPKALAEKARPGKTVQSCNVLPYPSEPRLRTIEHPKHGVCPSFCYRPEICQGRSSCPTNPSCTS